MPSFSGVLAAATILGLTAAVPSRGSNCPANTSFYTCSNNGFVGCCSVDACSVSKCPDGDASLSATITVHPSINPASSSAAVAPTELPSTTTPLAVSSSATTVASASPSPSDCIVGTYNATMWAVMPDDPSFSAKNSDLPGGEDPYYVRQDEGGKNRRLQVILFPNLPSNAKDCQLAGWRQPGNGTNFGYFGFDSRVENYHLNLDGKKLTDIVDTVSWETIEPLIGEDAGSGAFTQWPQLSSASGGSGGGRFECGSEIAFLSDTPAKGMKREMMVVMDQIEAKQAGWRLTYKTC